MNRPPLSFGNNKLPGKHPAPAPYVPVETAALRAKLMGAGNHDPEMERKLEAFQKHVSEGMERQKRELRQARASLPSIDQVCKMTGHHLHQVMEKAEKLTNMLVQWHDSEKKAIEEARGLSDEERNQYLQNLELLFGCCMETVQCDVRDTRADVVRSVLQIVLLANKACAEDENPGAVDKIDVHVMPRKVLLNV